MLGEQGRKAPCRKVVFGMGPEGQAGPFVEVGSIVCRWLRQKKSMVWGREHRGSAGG